MAQRIIAFDDTTERLVRTTKDPADIGTASSTGEAVNAGSEAIAGAATSKAVTFVNAFSNVLYGVAAQLVNTTDATVQYQPLTITSKSTSGFTATFNAPTDSANYLLDYIAVDPCLTYRAGSTILSTGVSSLDTVMFLTSSYSLISQMHNTVDALPLFQPDVVSLQEASIDATAIPQFTHLWNVNTDSSNYKLEFIANNVDCSTVKAFITNLSNGATSASINFPFFDMESTTYAVVARFQNITDSDASILKQPITITAKNTGSFVAKWNTALDTANYKMEWICHVVTVP